MATRVFAPAKINLALHVTGRRADGYHLLDSLVAFADVGDVVTVAPATVPSFRLSGPEAASVPTGDDNMVLRVVRAFSGEEPLAVTLEKVLPVASGMGGGSADAAACYRALRQLAGQGDAPAQSDLDRLLALGADVPMCVGNQAARVRGIGEDLTPLPGFPILHAVLVNPRVPVATPDVFRGLTNRNNPGLDALPEAMDAQSLTDWLLRQRNDLQDPAIQITPEIETVLSALVATGASLARMSGSGATCFALYSDRETQHAAADALQTAHPGWWVAPTLLGSQP